jgi:signal transduction histidine kinase
MQQVVMNLVLNAIEAMEEMPVTNRKLAVTAHLQTEGYVTVEIRDQGRGLADPTRIFEPFFTTKERGMGIGLSLCRSIVQAHGGQLSAANNTDVPGATFTFSIPTLQD